MSEAAAIPENTGAIPQAAKDNKKVSQSYWSLVWWKFRKNRLAVIGAVILLIYYITCIFFAEFFAPYPKDLESDYFEARPTYFQFRDDAGNFSLRPFVYGLEEKIDLKTRSRLYEYDKTVKYPIYFFVKGEPYKLLGFIPANIHLFGTDPANPDAKVFLLGTDKLGRDQFSRILYGGRISLFIGLFSVAVFLFIGVTLGAISGYYGGTTDIVVMRITELLSAFPQEPLFLALGAAVPVAWPSTRVFFIVTILLALVQWGGLARQVRGLVLSGREEQYVLAAQSFGASDRRIIFNHLIPATMSHVIVIATLKIPQMILLETALSFLGLGLVPPTVSWGTLLQNANTIRAISFAPWYLFVVPFILFSILAYNMLGDGLRDAMDPYSK
ncbi:MAG TPA: ABC transporter permease [Anaerolineales bacterium]|nr:ABC transporter permease [Anaerolineales bacterium]